MRYLAIMALLALPGCISDGRLAKLQADRAIYVCSHTVAVSAAAKYTIAHAETLFSNEKSRAVALAGANSDLALISTCPPA